MKVQRGSAAGIARISACAVGSPSSSRILAARASSVPSGATITAPIGTSRGPCRRGGLECGPDRLSGGVGIGRRGFCSVLSGGVYPFGPAMLEPGYTLYDDPLPEDEIEPQRERESVLDVEIEAIEYTDAPMSESPGTAYPDDDDSSLSDDLGGGPLGKSGPAGSG